MKESSIEKLKAPFNELSIEDEVTKKIIEVVEKTIIWFDGYSKSHYYNDLNSKNKEKAEDIIADFTKLMFYHHQLCPDKWSENELDEFFLITLPNYKNEEDDLYFESIFSVLYSFFTYLKEEKDILSASKFIDKLEKMGSNLAEFIVNKNIDEIFDDRMSEAFEQVYEWYFSYIESDIFHTLSESQKTYTEDIIMVLTEFMYNYHDSVPSNWNKDNILSCCLKTIPEHLCADNKYFQCLCPNLYVFFTYLNKNKLLKDALNISINIKENEDRILANAFNPEKWDAMKVIGMAALSAGFDITDEEEMAEFIELYDDSLALDFAEILIQPEKFEIELYESNDLCSCNSGKKYLNCCGK